MNISQKNIFALAVLACAAYVPAASAVTPYYSIRSQGVNTVRELVGWQDLINLCDECKFYGAFAIAAEYSQTFRSNRICECLFGNTNFNTNTSTTAVSGINSCNTNCNTNCNTGCNDSCNGCAIAIQGSCVTDGAIEGSWLADYFGLPTDFSSVVRFSPRIRNFVADVEFYVGLDEWASGLWFRLNLPITNTRWDLRFCETVINAGENGYPAGYFSPANVERAQLLDNATQFFSGCFVPTFGTDSDIVFQPLRYSKWATDNCSCNGLSKTRLADVEAALGYNFVCSENGYFGLSLRSEAPTGNRPEGIYLFEPIVGNGHHWTLGVGVNAKAVLWTGCEDNSNFSAYLDANIVHFFNTCQTRTFDLCSQGANSRYMLAQRLTESTGGLFTEGTDATAATLQFANEFAPVANLTASQVDVSVSVQGDVTLKFAYQNDCGFTFDFGYNFWGKACEDICRKSGCNGNIDLSQWALKGDANVYGFLAATSDFDPIALVATQSGADITSGLNYVDVDCASFVNVNAEIDSPALAFSTTGIVVATPSGDDALQTNISTDPVVLTAADLNLAAVRGISNKVFAHFNWTWQDCEDWVPFIGVGASAEFGQGCNTGCATDCNTNCNTSCNTNNNCGSSCGTSCDDNSSCNRCSISQWAVWVKGGIAFN